MTTETSLVHVKSMADSFSTLSSNDVLLDEELAGSHPNSAADGAMSVQPSAWWKAKSKSYWLALTLSLAATYLGLIGTGLLIKLYFVNGGSRVWISAWIQTAGFPIPAVAAALLFWKKGFNFTTPFSSPKVLAAFVFLGCLNSVDSFLLSRGVSYLPASTAGILFSSQLAFNAVFAILLTGHKLTAFSWNTVVLVISSAVILALDSRGDKLPPGVTAGQRVLGYIMTIAASAVYGLINPLTQLVFDKLLTKRSCALNPLLVIFEYQAYICLIATIASTVAMSINHDFRAMHAEAHSFKGGETVYYMTLIGTTIFSQIVLMGSIGIIYLASALLVGVALTSLIPIGAIFSAYCFHESFGGLKIMAVIIAVWGSASYVYGGYVDLKKSQNIVRSL